MSAFLVTQETINRVVSAMLPKDASCEDGDRLGTEMIMMNYRALAARYGDPIPSDLGLSTKYAFMNIGGSDVHASLNFGVSFPIADIDKDLTDGYTVYEPSLSLAKDFTGNNSQVFTQIGIGFVDRTREPSNPANRTTAHHEFFWHTGFFIPYNEHLIFSGEFSWVSDELTRGGHENQLYLTPGAIWDLPGHWELGIGVPIGLNKDSDDYQVIAALIYEFEIP